MVTVAHGLKRKEGGSGAQGGGGGGSSFVPLTKESRLAARETQRQLELALKYGLPLLVLLASAAFYFVASKGTTIVTLRADNTEKLKDVFFGGQPWLVLCTDFKTSQTSDVFKRAAADLEPPPHGFRAGMLDCHAKLPSGLTTIERFGLDPTTTPVIVVAANGKKPVQATLEAIKSPQKLALFAENFAKVTYGQPKSSADLESVCLTKKMCGLILHGAKLDTAQSEVMRDLVFRHRNISFSFINTKKLSFSLADRIPETPENEPRFLLISKSAKGDKSSEDSADQQQQQPKKLAAKAYKGEFRAKLVSDFIQDASAHPEKLTELGKRPTLSGKSSSTKSSSSGSSSSKGKSRRVPPARERIRDQEAEVPSATEDQADEPQRRRPVPQREEDPGLAAQRERERQRRMEMDEEAEDLIQAIVDSEEEEDSEEEVEEESESRESGDSEGDSAPREDGDHSEANAEEAEEGGGQGEDEEEAVEEIDAE